MRTYAIENAVTNPATADAVNAISISCTANLGPARARLNRSFHHLGDGATITYDVRVADQTRTLIADHARVRGAIFPGSAQVQTLRWSLASLLFNRRDGLCGLPSDEFESYFTLTVLHSDFDPDWPIATDWKAVTRGLRGSLELTQAEFADLLGLGRATVERWESGRTAPFRGSGLQLLTVLRPHITTPLQAGQALNVAASVVLPHVTRPTAEYTGGYIVKFLRSGAHDHSDLGPALLNSLEASRILVSIDSSGDELEDTYFPLAARLRPGSEFPDWADELVRRLELASDADRNLILNMTRRLTDQVNSET